MTARVIRDVDIVTNVPENSIETELPITIDGLEADRFIQIDSDGAALEAAVANAPADERIAIIVSGNNTISSPLVLKPNMILSGPRNVQLTTPRGTITRGDFSGASGKITNSTASAFTVTANQGTSINQLQIEGNNNSQGIEASGASGITIDGVTIQNCNGVAINLANCDNATIKNATVQSTSGKGIVVTSSSNLKIQDSVVDSPLGGFGQASTSGGGIDMSSITGGTISNVRVTNSPGSGIAGSNMSNVTVSGSTLQNFKADALPFTGTNSNITIQNISIDNVDSSGSDGVFLVNCSTCTVKDSTFTRINQSAIGAPVHFSGTNNGIVIQNITATNVDNTRNIGVLISRTSDNMTLTNVTTEGVTCNSYTRFGSPILPGDDNSGFGGGIMWTTSTIPGLCP